MVDGDVALSSQLVDELLNGAWSDDFVGFALNDDSGRGTRCEKAEIIHVGWRRDRNESANLGPAHQQLHAYPGAKTYNRDPGGFRFGVDRLYPVKCTRSVAQFANAVVEQPLALADTAKIEPQSRKASFHEGLVEKLHDLVVHRAARLWMRVQDEGYRRSRSSAGVETSFEASLGSRKNDFGHESDGALKLRCRCTGAQRPTLLYRDEQSCGNCQESGRFEPKWKSLSRPCRNDARSCRSTSGDGRRPRTMGKSKFAARGRTQGTSSARRIASVVRDVAGLAA